MNQAEHTQEQKLGALVDGELAPEEACALYSRAADDPALAQSIAALASIRSAASAFRAQALDEPVPNHWIEMIDNVTRPTQQMAAAPRSAGARSWVRRVNSRAAMAAVLAAGVAAAVVLPRPSSTPIAFNGRAGLVATAHLSDALSTLPSGMTRTVGAVEFAPRLSYVTGERVACREGELAVGARSSHVLACHVGDQWVVKAYSEGSAQPNTGYRTAGGDDPLGVMIGADATPLDQAGEARMIAEGWIVRAR